MNFKVKASDSEDSGPRRNEWSGTCDSKVRSICASKRTGREGGRQGPRCPLRLVGVDHALTAGPASRRAASQGSGAGPLASVPREGLAVLAAARGRCV